MYACVFMFTLDPIITPSSQWNLSDLPVFHLLSDILPFNSSPGSKMSSSKCSLLIFTSVDLNYFLSPLLFFYFFGYHFCLFTTPHFLFPIFLSRLTAWSCTSAIYLPPLMIWMSQYVPGTLEVQLESHVVRELRISPFINKTSVQPVVCSQCALSVLKLIRRDVMWVSYQAKCSVRE